MENRIDYQIKYFIRELLKRNNQTYGDLSTALKLSLPGMKRLMAKGSFTVFRIEKIANFFNMSLSQFLELCQKRQGAVQELSDAQEQEIAKDPLGMKLLILLSIGLSLKNIREKLTSSELKRLNKALLRLEKVELLEFKNMDSIILKKGGPYRFRKNGELAKKILKPYLELISNKILNPSSGDLVNRNFELYLSTNSIQKLKLEIEDVISKYTNVGIADVHLLKVSELQPVTCSFFVSQFDGWGHVLTTD